MVRDAPERLVARARILGDRIDTAGLERTDTLSINPLAFRAGGGFAVVFRYGVVVTVGLTPIEEDAIAAGLRARVRGPVTRPEEETATIEIAPDHDDQVTPGGRIAIRQLTPERLVVIADILAKSTALAQNEIEVAAVFDVIDPLARRLAETGRASGGRRAILKHIGRMLLVQHRVSGRVAVEEKPEVLWDQPGLERLYARIEDEYELRERTATLHRKLAVIGETATALTDLIHTNRSLRLEIVVVLLIALELVINVLPLLNILRG
ncbi:RMD1 family protein [Methylobacterium sp. DCY52]|uniref:RMD1 family protein n=1 Tax=Methylobacterium sp. DCY52 TaxID=739139 RepID=UPI00406C5994